MSWKAQRAIYQELVRRLREATDQDERAEIRVQMDIVAPKIDQVILLPNKHCRVCGAQMESTMRKPWWTCRDHPDEHWELKKRFRPDPPLTEKEWLHVGETLANRVGFVVTAIRCARCHQRMTVDGEPIPDDDSAASLVLKGYRRHWGANNVYAFPALLIHLGVEAGTLYQLRTFRYAGSVDEPTLCIQCQLQSPGQG